MNYVKDAFITAVCQRANIDDNVFNFEGRWIETTSNNIYPARGTFADVINEAGLIGDVMYRLISRRTPTVDIDIINDCAAFSIPYCSPSLRLDMIWDKFRTTGDTMTLGEKFTFTDPNVGSHEAQSFFISSKEVNSSGFQYIESYDDNYCGALVQFTHSEQIDQDHKHYRMLINDGSGEDLMLYRWLVIKNDGSTKDVVKWYKRDGPKSQKMVKYNDSKEVEHQPPMDIINEIQNKDSGNPRVVYPYPIDSKEVEHQPPIDIINEIQNKDNRDPSYVYPYPIGYEDPYADNEEIQGSNGGVYYFDGSSNRIIFLPEDVKARVVPKEEYENQKVDASSGNILRRIKPDHVRDEERGVPCGDGEICDPDTGIEDVADSGNGVPCGDGDICDPNTGIGNGVQSYNVEIAKSDHVRDEERGVPCGDGEICDPGTGIEDVADSGNGVPCGDGDICDPNTASVKSRVKSRKGKKNKKKKNKNKKIGNKFSKTSNSGRKRFLNHGKRTPHESL